MPQSNKTSDEHQELVHAYSAAIPKKLNEIRMLWRTARQDQARGEVWEPLYRLVHQLAGSGTVFGFPAITDTARAVLGLLRPIKEAGNPISAEIITPLEKSLAALCLVLENAANPGGSAAPVEPLAPARAHGGDGDGPELLYLVEDGESQAKMLAQQLLAYGYKTSVFSDIDAFMEAAQGRPPQALILDILFSERSIAHLDAVRKLNQRLTKPAPMLLVSARTDLQSRLQALKAGTAAYFTKPVNPKDMVLRLDEWLRPETTEPYRILIVDDDRELAKLYQQALQEAGMETLVINDPLQVMQPLIDFRPDLLLLDCFMPGCSGLELAVALRQENTYTQLPIIFISQEADPQKRLTCIGIGADDFVNKPVVTDYLVSLVAARVRRGRQLQKMIARDSLTTLLNHDAFLERLENILGLAARKQVHAFVLAMFDVDHFKSINDLYGHLAGDITLKNIAQRLKQGVRGTDIVARYGGDEFAMVLIEAQHQAALLRLEKIRETIAKVSLQVTDHTLRVTCSVGVFSYNSQSALEPLPASTTELISAADLALYRAKRNGGNQVWIA